MSDRPLPGRRSVLRGSLVASAALTLPVGLGAAPAFARSRRRQGVRCVWSGDLAGQGWGINESIGGYRIFDAMAKVDPDFFLCSGDNIYADGPIAATATLPDGSVYRNVTTEEKSHVATTLDDYRGNFRYNLLDQALRRFNAQVPNIIQWDDHEVRNNWYPGE